MGRRGKKLPRAQKKRVLWKRTRLRLVAEAPKGYAAGMGRRTNNPQSQVVNLFLSVAEALGYKSDKEVARLADVVPLNVSNWRSGSVASFKNQTLEAIKRGLVAQLEGLMLRADVHAGAGSGLHPLVIEEGAGPDELLRQFRDRIGYDYAGHRFLYYEPQGSLAWLNLIQTGYDQTSWLRGTRQAAEAWGNTAKDTHGRPKGPIAAAIQRGRSGGYGRGLDIVGLGVGDGAKETAVLEALLASEAEPEWVTFLPIDVSIPLLLRAGAAGRAAMARADQRMGPGGSMVLPTCADFEEGPLAFLSRLRTSVPSGEGGVRLILLLGNIFGNLRDEDRFVRERLWRMARPGDLVWVEVATRIDPITSDPLYSMTNADRAETAAEASRRLLLQGPYRRWEAAMGRRPSELGVRVWVRQDDDSARVPGSCNFCHDLVIEDAARVCTMLYSRRYEVESLVTWFEEREFSVERIHTVRDSKRRPRVSHLLLQRR